RGGAGGGGAGGVAARGREVGGGPPLEGLHPRAPLLFPVRRPAPPADPPPPGAKHVTNLLWVKRGPAGQTGCLTGRPGVDSGTGRPLPAVGRQSPPIVGRRHAAVKADPRESGGSHRRGGRFVLEDGERVNGVWLVPEDDQADTPLAVRRRDDG